MWDFPIREAHGLMQQYILRRLLLTLPVLGLVTLVLFILLRLIRSTESTATWARRR